MATASTLATGKNSSSIDDMKIWFETSLGGNKSSDMIDELKFDIWRDYLKPNAGEWILIFLYLIVFAVSLTGNFLSKYSKLLSQLLSSVIEVFCGETFCCTKRLRSCICF